MPARYLGRCLNFSPTLEELQNGCTARFGIISVGGGGVPVRTAYLTC